MSYSGLPILDPTVRAMVLQHLVAQTETEEDPDRLQQLAGAGLTPEVVNRLGQLNSVEFHTLCTMKSRDLTLILNPEGLLLNIRTLEASREAH